MKNCIKCNIVKSLNDFPKRKESKDGRRGHCISCEKHRKKEYRLKYPNVNKEYILKNIDKFRKYKNHLEKRKRTNDPLYKLKHNLRVRTCKYFKITKITKRNKTLSMIGITPIELKNYIEKKFTEGMTWDNYGKWHIDHIIPLNSVNSEEGIIKLCHYTNLQPLWATDNIRKKDRQFECQKAITAEMVIKKIKNFIV
jgi:hypothetical protein